MENRIHCETNNERRRGSTPIGSRRMNDCVKRELYLYMYGDVYAERYYMHNDARRENFHHAVYLGQQPGAPEKEIPPVCPP
jgi:hypothetical protein